MTNDQACAFSSTATDALEKMTAGAQHDHGAARRPRVGVQNYRLPLRAGADGFFTRPNISLPLLEKEAHVHLAVHRRRSGEILAGMLELTGAAVEFA
jgi:hypothetical protein